MLLSNCQSRTEAIQEAGIPDGTERGRVVADGVRLAGRLPFGVHDAGLGIARDGHRVRRRITVHMDQQDVTLRVLCHRILPGTPTPHDNESWLVQSQKHGTWSMSNRAQLADGTPSLIAVDLDSFARAPT